MTMAMSPVGWPQVRWRGSGGRVVPRRSDDDAADANRRQVRLTPPRPVLVGHVDGGNRQQAIAERGAQRVGGVIALLGLT